MSNEGRGRERCARGFPIVVRGRRNFLEYDVIEGGGVLADFQSWLWVRGREEEDSAKK